MDRNPTLTDATLEFAHALFDVDALPAALARVAGNLGAAGATLVMGSTSRGSVACTDSIADIVRDYMQDWVARDPREAKVQPSMLDGFSHDFSDFTLAEIAREPFYQEFLVPRGFSWHAACALVDAPDTMVLSLKRPTDRGPFTHVELAQYDRALPDLRRAAALGTEHWRIALRGQLTLLERLERGAVVLDRRLRVLALNALATHDDGLMIRDARLRAAYPGERAKLQQCIEAVTADRAPVPAIRRLVLHRVSDGAAVLVECTRLGLVQPGLPSSAATIVVSRVLRPDLSSFHERMCALFGLTQREAALCVLIAEGRPMRECADALGITLNHARQRAKRVYAKLGVRGQATLVALVARM